MNRGRQGALAPFLSTFRNSDRGMGDRMWRSSNVVAAIVGGLILAACEASAFFDPRDFRELAEAEAQWKARSFADYTYEIRILCFCPPEISQWTRVTVRAGTVTAAEAVEPNPNNPITTLQYWDPIDSLFADVRRTMTDPASRAYLDAVVIEYDPELRYPTNIEYRAKSNVADGGSQFLLRNVRPLD
jgi:hypothetical protein